VALLEGVALLESEPVADTLLVPEEEPVPVVLDELVPVPV